MIQRDDRPVIYFAVYVDVQGMSPQKAKDTLAHANALINREQENWPFRERFFIFPIQGTSRIELLYPTGPITSERIEKMHDKYQEILNRIEQL